LTLTPFNFGASDDEDKEKKSVLDVETEKCFTKTKKMICDIIVDSYKDSLAELNLLELLTGPEVSGNSKLTVTVGKILENLEQLEEKGVVHKKDNYKSVMESIQTDIKQKSMMREKIEKESEIMKAVRTLFNTLPTGLD